MTPASPIAGAAGDCEPPCGPLSEVDPIAIATKMPENAHETPRQSPTVGEVGVLTVDDQAVFRSVARDVIAATPGFESVGEVGSGEEALSAVELLHPNLVLIDVRMPGIGGVEAARRVIAASPETVVVLISIEDQEAIAEDVRLCGAAALVRKQDFGPALLRRLWDAHGTRP